MNIQHCRRWCLGVAVICLLAWGLPAAAQDAKPEWQDPQVVAVNRLPMRASFFAFESLEKAVEGDRAASERFLSLNGPWKFMWVERLAQKPVDFQKPAFDDKGWKEFPVPSNWEFAGYGTPIYLANQYEFAVKDPRPPEVPTDVNPVGSYRRTFMLPKSFEGREVILHIGAVKSAVYVWVNGQSVGYSEDSKLAAEFDITKFVKPGENLIALQIYRWSDASYLECQDFWRVSGIERDVFLYARPATHLQDFRVGATLDDKYVDGLFSLDLQGNGAACVVSLADPGGTTVFSRKQAFSGASVHFEGRISEVKAWSAEIPDLYRMDIQLLDAKGDLIEAVSRPVGFCRVEIRDGNFLINGRRVFFKGVNRHEHDPETIHVISREQMERDIRLMKMFNVNAVRTSHYPNDPLWYDLCDRHGLYVIDEANVESHGMGYEPDRTLAAKPEWRKAHMERIQRMVLRDRNHPCIVTWSLGNESGNGANFVEGYNWIKKTDPTRPVQYERAELEENTDIYCPMYPHPRDLVRYSLTRPARPLIMCEYAHAMGNSEGNLREYWDIIKRYPSLQGGFIWDWVDQSVYLEKNGRRMFGYGGDWGRPGTPSSNNFVCNGLVQSDRQPHPHAFEAKKVYESIGIRLLDRAEGRLLVRNGYDFRDLKNVRLAWSLLRDGVMSGGSVVEDVNCPPGGTRVVELGMIPAPEAGRELVLQVSAVTRAAEDLVPAGHELAHEEIILDEVGRDWVFQPDRTSVQVEETSAAVTVKNAKFGLTIDRASGTISRYEVVGKPMVDAGPRPSFWRPCTDNDFGAGLQFKMKEWKDAGRTEPAARVAVTRDPLGADGVVSVRVEIPLLNGDALQETDYAVDGRGAITVRNRFQALRGNHPDLFKYGHHWVLPAEFNAVEWYGRGPHESYVDRKASAFLGTWRGSILDQYHPYVRPQEGGNRTDVRWARLSRPGGAGLEIRFVDGPLNITVLPYSPDQLYPGEAKGQTHSAELAPDGRVHLHVDAAQMGLGGIESWGALPLEEYRLPYRDYSYAYRVIPVERYMPLTPPLEK